MKKHIQNISFDAIRKVEDNGIEYWSARELATLFGYSEYRNMKQVIDRAMELCSQNNKPVSNHFVEYNEMVSIGSGAKRMLKNEIAACGEQNIHSVVQYFWRTAEIIKYAVK